MTILPESETMRDCPICKGTGNVGAATFTTIGGATRKRRTKQSCPECGGSGKISRERGAWSSLG
jgi:DnaJ-class molecular chaperone